MFRIPDGLVRATLNREGSAGADWLAELPAIVMQLLDAWDCEVDGEAQHGEVALVVPVRQRETAAALKVSFPHPGNESEPDALRRFGGHGAIQLLENSDETFGLLLERAGPDNLAGVESIDEAIEIAGDLARQLAVLASSSTPALADTADGWEEQLDRQIAAVPDALPPAAVQRARSTIRALSTEPTATMLHGDLHFRNVLAAERQPWLAIDPKGWRGTAAYDAFTVAAGNSAAIQESGDIHRALQDHTRRSANAASVDVGLATACVQARATSSYLYQLLQTGDWFDLVFLRHAAPLHA